MPVGVHERINTPMPIASMLMDAIHSQVMMRGARSGYLRLIRWMMCMFFSFLCSMCHQCNTKGMSARYTKVYEKYV